MNKKLQNTRQKNFEKALIRVWNQGCKSTNFIGSCVYRGPNGIKCNLGHCITDKQYKAAMEGITPIGEVSIFPTFFLKDSRFYGDLQQTHDNAYEPFMLNYLHNMLDFGKIYGLDVSKVQRRMRMLKEKNT